MSEHFVEKDAIDEYWTNAYMSCTKTRNQLTFNFNNASVFYVKMYQYLSAGKYFGQISVLLVIGKKKFF